MSDLCNSNQQEGSICCQLNLIDEIKVLPLSRQTVTRECLPPKGAEDLGGEYVVILCLVHLHILYRCNYTVNAGKLMFKEVKSTRIKTTYAHIKLTTCTLKCINTAYTV